MIPRLRKSHVFTCESENVQGEDRTRLKPEAGGLARQRSSPFPFKLKDGFRNLWKLAVRFDGRHCGMRTLSTRRPPPVSSKLLWQFALSSVADWRPWRPRSLACGYRPADRTNKAVDKPCVSGFFGGFLGFRKSFLVCLAGRGKRQVSGVSSRNQQTLVHISWPPTACFSRLLNISPHIRDCVFSI